MEISPLPTPAPEVWAEQFAASLHAQRARACEFLAAQQKRLEKAGLLIEEQFLQLEEELKTQRDEAGRLQVEHDALTARLATAESRLAEAENRMTTSEGDGDRQTAHEDLQRRCELALEDLRQARNINSELQQQLAKARSTAAKLAQQAQQPGRLDWEAEKRRIVAALEADFDEGNKSRQAERLTIEEVLRTTEEIIAAKDREIQELKQRLEEPDGKRATKMPDVPDIDQAINNDLIVREERERLKRLQEEWREKLRQAEVEISLERAKIARQRADLEEQLQTAKAGLPPDALDAADTARQAESSARGRWLARLGLTAADQEPGRHL